MPTLPGITKGRNKTLPNLPPLISPPIPMRESGRSKAEPTSSRSSGSSSDSHSSGSRGSSSPQTSLSSQSKLSSGTFSIPQESSPQLTPLRPNRLLSEATPALPPPKRSIPLKRHSPLNPASFSDLPSHHPKPQVRPGINPLTRESYRKSSTPAIPSHSYGSRLYLNRRATDENLFSPPTSPYTPSSSGSSLLRGSSLSLLSDWKFESALLTKDGGLIPFPSNLYLVDNEPMNDEDRTYTSDEKLFQVGNYSVSARGVGNIVTLVFLISAIVALFIIYPMFSFYLYTNQNPTVLNNGNSTNGNTTTLNTRNQLHLLSTNVASNVLDAGASEYELGFADEWETDGRRFGPNQDQIWVSLIYNDKSTTRKGYLVSDRQVHLQMQTPYCLSDSGFIDVGFVDTDIGERWHAYWSGNWTVVKEVGKKYIPHGSSVRGPIMVALHIESGKGLSQVAVDYVRFYSIRGRHACADDIPQVSLHLDLSRHEENRTLWHAK